MLKNRFFRHISGIFGQKIFFSKIGLHHILGIAILHLCAKNKKKLESILRKAENREMVKGNFPKKRKSVIYNEKKFSGKNCFGHFLEHIALYLSAKNQKKLMKQFCTKSKKPYFQAVFGPNLPKKFFFQKSCSVTFWELPFCIIVPISRQAGNRRTNERTNERTNIG